MPDQECHSLHEPTYRLETLEKLLWTLLVLEMFNNKHEQLIVDFAQVLLELAARDRFHLAIDCFLIASQRENMI